MQSSCADWLRRGQGLQSPPHLHTAELIFLVTLPGTARDLPKSQAVLPLPKWKRTKRRVRNSSFLQRGPDSVTCVLGVSPVSWEAPLSPGLSRSLITPGQQGDTDLAATAASADMAGGTQLSCASGLARHRG